ncbi:MAG TPA: aldo/keto reductase [Terriglobales bacterium]|nr:aldo/keto reductase [Terriglobales bacterium]
MSQKEPSGETNRPRREFLKMGGAATAGFLAGSVAGSQATAFPPLPENPATAPAMSTRNLGRTGYRTALFSLGGQAAIEQPNNEAAAAAIVERALDLGVNYVDTAAAYGGEARWSQRYIGQVMKRRRAQVFLASKTHDRTRDGSLRLLEESLRLLNTDHLDLWQVHNLSRMEQVEQIFAKGGAMEALEQARAQKMVRYLGVTGHADPDVLIAAIQRFPFDTILLALNAADKHHRSFIERLLPLAVEKEMGIIGMKVPARGRILSSWKPSASDSSSWAGGSRPGTVTMREALYYVLSLPVSTVIVGCDSVQQLEENVELARRFTPLSDSQMAALVARTKPIARQALFFRRA